MKKWSIILLLILCLAPLSFVSALGNNDLPKLRSSSCSEGEYIYSVDFKKKDFQCREDQEGNVSGNLTDTNASTECALTEVLLGNASCYNSTLFFDDTTLGDGHTHDQDLNISSNVTHYSFNTTNLTVYTPTNASRFVNLIHNVSDAVQTGYGRFVSYMDYLIYHNTTSNQSFISLADSFCNATDCYTVEDFLNNTDTDTQKGTSGIYLYNDSSLIYLNESELNNTIDDRAGSSTKENQTIIFHNGEGSLTADSAFFGVGTQDTTEADAIIVIPFDITIKGMTCFQADASGSERSGFTLRDDAGDTAITCTTAAGARICSQVGQSVSVAAGSELGIDYEEVVASTTGYAACSIIYTAN